MGPFYLANTNYDKNWSDTEMTINPEVQEKLKTQTTGRGGLDMPKGPPVWEFSAVEAACCHLGPSTDLERV